MNNQELFKQSLVGLGLIYDKDLSSPVIKIYWRSLSEFTDEQVQRAIEVAANTLKFFPRPVELRAIITGDSAENAHDAWARVMSSLRDPSRTSGLSNEILDIVHSLGGMRGLSLTSENRLDFIKNDFVAMYQSAASRTGDNSLGMIAQDNAIELKPRLHGESDRLPPPTERPRSAQALMGKMKMLTGGDQ